MSKYDEETGLPTDKTYLEKGLPSFLQKSLNAVIKCWNNIDPGIYDKEADWRLMELWADINTAEADQVISHEQANYLREVYVRLEY